MRGGRGVGAAGSPRVSVVIRIPIYGTPVLLLYFDRGKDATEASVVREARKKLGRGCRDFDFAGTLPAGDGEARTFFGEKGTVIALTGSSGPGDGAATAGRIAHECFHVVMSVAEDYGFELDQAHDEPAAYLMGWLAEHVTSRLSAAGIRILAEEP